MFNDVQYIEELLAGLEIHRVLFACDKEFKGDILDQDDYWVMCDEKIMELSYNYHYFDGSDSTMYQFCFKELREFYELCKEYCKRINVNFKKSSFVKKAEDDVFEMLRYSGADNIQWNLWVPKKIINKRKYMLIIETGCYFNEGAALLEVLYDIKNYYGKQRDEMKKLLEDSSKIIKMPLRKKEEKAA